MPHADPEVRRAYCRARYASRAAVRARQKAASDRWRKKPGVQTAINIRAAKRRSHLKQRYGLTVAQWDRMLIAQAGRCDCCDSPMTQKVCVDHNHATGAIRGLVCQHCNVGIAWVESRSYTLSQAARYLERWGSR